MSDMPIVPFDALIREVIEMILAMSEAWKMRALAGKTASVSSPIIPQAL